MAARGYATPAGGEKIKGQAYWVSTAKTKADMSSLEPCGRD
jgi:hypothetical protein